jgi:hypothetical protein
LTSFLGNSFVIFASSPNFREFRLAREWQRENIGDNFSAREIKEREIKYQGAGLVFTFRMALVVCELVASTCAGPGCNLMKLRLGMSIKSNVIFEMGSQSSNVSSRPLPSFLPLSFPA